MLKLRKYNLRKKIILNFNASHMSQKSWAMPCLLLCSVHSSFNNSVLMLETEETRMLPHSCLI